MISGSEETKPNKANLLSFGVFRKESQGLRSANVKIVNSK